MSGIYLHIPFCKQACHYCNFHFSTSLQYRKEVVEAMVRELELRQDYLEAAPLQSIYFGGGTPSILQAEELECLFAKIEELFEIAPAAEITLEANPDDLSPERLAFFRGSPINRLSIGIQSFSDEDLKFMNRAHDAAEASRCIDLARAYGFDNLTVDLIYGTPTMNDVQWAQNIERVLAQDVPHISCYCLTVEPRTALDHFVKTGKAQPVDEAQAERQFIYLIERLERAGYEHYEISNFARPGHYAIHNSAYWLGKPYLGIGPGAHSYDGKSRQWNVANNTKYRKALAEDQLPFEKELLTEEQNYNEYVLTRLRTRWGVVPEELPSDYRDYFLKQIQPYLQKGQVKVSEGAYLLTKPGKLLADRIAMELFF
jgi:oxygen-independent coproporphyrinogen-3 oxidase